MATETSGEVDLPVLESALRAGVDAALKVEDIETISVGASNRMFLAHTSIGPLILRVPPTHKTSPTAHDMGREFRILSALDHTDVPHAKAYALVADTAPFGTGFLVQEFVDGFNLKVGLDIPEAPTASERRDFAFAAVDALALTGAADWKAAGLEGFGKPDGFLERQVSRWSTQLEAYRVRDLPGIDELATWLNSHRPDAQEPGIMHGDFTFMNVMFSRSRPAKVAAVVDWEQSTIGDPLMDLGWFIGLWAHADEDSAATAPGTPWVTQLEGMPSRSEMVERYALSSGRDVSAVGFYQALALFKLAVVLEGNYAKFHSGVSKNQHHADFEWMVPQIIGTALAAAHGNR